MPLENQKTDLESTRRETLAVVPKIERDPSYKLMGLLLGGGSARFHKLRTENSTYDPNFADERNVREGFDGLRMLWWR